ncbi:uncharacterized protein LOC125774288 [Anopheles funestus]|uniref:uncharacterized protein LOC125774288 n=1 Tax=Anopheles funestus TaxID=62324 RepID=UPI0020C674A6|nr:uncharacterized protein LOC125774288 [Anopheles funestus]
MSKVNMSPRVVLTLLDLTKSSSVRSTPERAPTPAPRMSQEIPGEPETAARKRTAPTPSPRRTVTPEMPAPAASPSEAEAGSSNPWPLVNASHEQAIMYERLVEQLEELNRRLERTERENARLRAELNLYRTGINTVVRLEDSATGVRLGNQATTKSGPSKKTLRRKAQRDRVLARQSQGPAQQRLLELQEHLRREIAEEQITTRNGQGQGERHKSQSLQRDYAFPPLEVRQQQQRSYRDMVSGWQVVGQRSKAQPSAAPQQQRQRPQHPVPTQRPVQTNQRSARRRPDAILVVPAPGVPFAEMYRPIRTCPALEDAQQYIRIGKRTPKGNLRMELARDADSAALCRRIQATLGELGTVKVLTEMAEVVLKNVDNLTEEDTIREALREALTKEPAVASLKMWERADATKRARVRLPRVEAEVILSKNHLLIDHSSCQLEKAPRLEAAKLRCFRCLERGHMAAVCSGLDRSNCCIRCGVTGHRAAACSSEVSCIRCGGPHRIAAHGCRGANVPPRR